MENPCKKCLVRSACTICCDKLLDFIRYNTDFMPTFSDWINKHEIRPRILSEYQVNLNKISETLDGEDEKSV